MMRHKNSLWLIIFLFQFFSFIFLIDPAKADLIDLGNGVTQDNKDTVALNDDQYWIQNLDLFKGLTYNEQIIAISNLDINGLANLNWHMATYSDLLNLESLYTTAEIANSFLPNNDPGDPPHWLGRYDREFYSSNPNDPNAPYRYEVNMWITSDGEYHWGLDVGSSDSIITIGAFVTAYTPAACVAEPSTLLFVAAGLIGLVGCRRKFKGVNA